VESDAWPIFSYPGERASGEPLIINGLPAGSHKVRIELVNANHQTLDQGVVTFVIPAKVSGETK
jgi:hypothetical protein